MTPCVFPLAPSVGTEVWRLGQDVYLLGRHGAARRWLALHFCAMMGREVLLACLARSPRLSVLYMKTLESKVEYVALTRDTTEADLKQRREIIAGGNARYFDQGVVTAAIHGRILILEGRFLATLCPYVLSRGCGMPQASRSASAMCSP